MVSKLDSRPVSSGTPSSRSSALSRSNIRKNASSPRASAYPGTIWRIRSAVRNCRVDSRQSTRFTSRSARAEDTSASYDRAGPARGRPARTHLAGATRPAGRSQRGDQALDPLVDRPERVLAQHGALGLVVELEVHPVHREVAPCGLGGGDEVAAQLGPGGLRRGVLGRLDLAVVGDAVDHALALQQVEQPAPAADVVVGEVELGDPRAGEVEPVAGPVPLDEPVLDGPVDLAVDQRQVLALDGVA